MALLIAVRDLFLAALALLLAAPLWLLPWEAALWLGRGYGRCVGRFWPSARRVSMINLRRAYGTEMTFSKAAAWTEDIFASMGQSFAEGIQFSRRYKSGKRDWRERCEVEDTELERRLLADPRPKVMAMGHLGSWEVAAMILSRAGGDGSGLIVRRMDNRFINGLVRRARTSKDSQWIEKKGAVAACLRRLQKGHSVALLIDENGGWKGPFVTFFGRPGSTRKTAALLALTSGAPLVVGAVVRRPGARKLLFKLALVEPESYGAGPEAIVRLTQEMARMYEAWVREYPLQWRWIHWRWKNRPGGEEETYTRGDLGACFDSGKRGEAGVLDRFA